MSTLSALCLIVLSVTVRSCFGQLYNDDYGVQPSIRNYAYNPAGNYNQQYGRNDYGLDNYRSRYGYNNVHKAPRYGDYDRDSYRDRDGYRGDRDYDNDRFNSRRDYNYKGRNNRYDYDYSYIKPTTCTVNTTTPSCVTTSTTTTATYVGAVCFQTATVTMDAKSPLAGTTTGTTGSCSPVIRVPHSRYTSDTAGTEPCYTTTLTDTRTKQVTCTYKVKETIIVNLDASGQVSDGQTQTSDSTNTNCYVKGTRMAWLGQRSRGYSDDMDEDMDSD